MQEETQEPEGDWSWKMPIENQILEEKLSRERSNNSHNTVFLSGLA